MKGFNTSDFLNIVTAFPSERVAARPQLLPESVGSPEFSSPKPSILTPRPQLQLMSYLTAKDPVKATTLASGVTSPSASLMASSSSSPPLIGSSGSSHLLSHIRMEHLAAGVTGGVVSTLVLHPLDLVKIRFAVNDGLTSRPQYNGLYDAFKSIWRTEGMRGLYR